MKKQIRVAITGIGMITPLGLDMPSTWKALTEKQSGIAPIQLFDASGFTTKIAAEVKNFDPSAMISDHKILKHATRPTQFALVAAEAALIDAGIRPNATTASRWGISVGSSMMNAEFSYWEKF